MEIIPRVFVAGRKEITADFVTEQGITHAINCTKTDKFVSTVTPANHFRCAWQDDHFQELGMEADVAAFHLYWLLDWDSTAKVVLYCRNGQRRSVTLLLYYLMTRCETTLADGMKLVAEKLPRVTLNDNFVRQLAEAELTVFPTSSYSVHTRKRNKLQK